MELVPSFVEMDGLVVPLFIRQADWRHPVRINTRCGDDRPLLDAFCWIANTMLGEPPGERWLERIDRSEDDLITGHISATLVRPDVDDYSENAEVWRRLTGTEVDLSDAYSLGTSFVRRSIAVPRTTFRKVMARLFELDAALQAGELEPRIDPDMVVPPPVPEPILPWEDQDWLHLEWDAEHLDEWDPSTEEGIHKVRLLRQRLYDALSWASELTRLGVDDWPGRCRALGLAMLAAYEEATMALTAYLADAERQALISSELPASPYLADVSVDLFRLPTKVPAGMTRYGWLARCEAVFVAARGGPDVPVGELVTQVAGQRVRMRYRREVGQHLTLWRVELV